MEQNIKFRKGMYTKEDKPIKLLNRLIIGAVAFMVVLVIVFALHGGFTITFDTDGGSRIENQVKRHGELLEEPKTPVKEGYEFVCYSTSPDGDSKDAWNFKEDKVEETMTLYAVWKEK